MSKPKILLTGASGFIGYHIIKNAIKEGYDVHAAVRASSQIGHLSDYPVSFVYPDFHHVGSVVEILKEQHYDYVIHAAAATRAPDQFAFNKANAEMTLNLANALRQSEIPLKQFVFISSLALSGPIPYDSKELILETAPPRPITGYGRSKLLAEAYLRSFTDLPIVTLRPTAVYGPRERDLLILFRSLSKGWESYIGKQNQKLSFVYVDDLVAAIFNALKAAPINGLICNISDGNVYEREDLSTIVKKVLNKKTFKFFVPVPIVQAVASVMELLYFKSKKAPLLYKERIGEWTAPNWGCDIENARKYLDYRPKFDLEKGVTETIRWYKEAGWLK